MRIPRDFWSENAEISAPPNPIPWAAALMGNRDHSDGFALNSKNQCVWETLEIQTNRSMQSSIADTGLLGGQTDDAPQFLGESAAGR